MKDEKEQDITEQKLYECQTCGRKQRFKFYGHATSKIANDFCDGKVKRIKWKNAW